MNQDLDLNGCRKLVAAIITQAVEDYQMFERKQVVRNGQINAGEANKIRLGNRIQRTNGKHYVVSKIGRGLQFEHQVHQLLGFLKRDMDEWINLASLDVHPDTIRSRLGMTEWTRKAHTPPAKKVKVCHVSKRDREAQARFKAKHPNYQKNYYRARKKARLGI